MLNLIKKINELFPKKRYTICSILNWMNDEAFDRFKKLEQEVNCKINFVYLFLNILIFIDELIIMFLKTLKEHK